MPVQVDRLQLVTMSVQPQLFYDGNFRVLIRLITFADEGVVMLANNRASDFIMWSPFLFVLRSNSAVQINVVKGCVSAVLAHATFDHVHLDSRVHVFAFDRCFLVRKGSNPICATD